MKMWFELKRSPPSNFLRPLQLAGSTCKEFLKRRILRAAHLLSAPIGDLQNYQFQWWGDFSVCGNWNQRISDSIMINRKLVIWYCFPILMVSIHGHQPYHCTLRHPLVQLFRVLHIESCPSHPHLDHHVSSSVVLEIRWLGQTIQFNCACKNMNLRILLR